MKKPLIVLLTIMTVIVLTACDAGLLIVGVEIEKYPTKLAYFAGVDTELDFTGGVLTFHLKEGSESTDEINEEIRYGSVVVSHNIDFNVPGVYVVQLNRPIESGVITLKYPIQVIDLGEFISSGE